MIKTTGAKNIKHLEKQVMIRSNKLLIAAGAVALTAGIYTTTVSAASVSASASANVVQALTITQTNGMDFGDVSVSGADGTVVLEILGGRTATGGADVLTGGGETLGSYTIIGEDTKAYTISYPASVLLTEDGGGPDTMTVDTFVDNADGTAAASPGEPFDLGATLRITNGQTPGGYSGSYTITVNYD